MRLKPQLLSTIFCTLTLLFVFIFYYHTLSYPPKAFDELAPFKETHVPVCLSFSLMAELIKNLGLHQHFESSNTLYSNIFSLRCDPLCAFLHLFVQFLFKKNVLLYRLYGLLLHLINTLLVFCIISKISNFFISNFSKTKIFLVSVLTLLWATHPVNVESVLLLTNANITLSYTFSFITFLFFLKYLLSGDKESKITLLKFSLLFFPFLIALFIAEFHFALPLILIFYAFAVKLNLDKKSFLQSMKICIPVFFAAFLFVISFLASPTRINIGTNFPINVTLERIFWLSPQTLFHFLGLLFLPIKLSIDQSLLVHIGNSLFDPYAVFCFLFVTLIFTLSIFSPFSFITFFLLLVSLLPFSQIPAPLYNLASERYLYFPSFILIFGLSHIVFYIFSKNINQKKVTLSITVLLTIILVAYSSRAFVRTLDWRDTISLYSSAIKATSNPLYKAIRYKGLIPNEKIFAVYPEKEVNPEYQKIAINYIEEAIKELKLKTQNSKLPPEARLARGGKTPQVVKAYGLDPSTLYAKAGYILAQSNFTLNNDYKEALEIIKPFVSDLSLFDSAALSFYGSLLYHNNMLDEAEEVLKTAYKQIPYSTKIIFALCDLIQIKYGFTDEIEKYVLSAFKYFPYDTFTLFALVKTYELKGDLKNYAYYSYIYGIRAHSTSDLENAKKAYLALNNKEMAEKVEKRINETKN